jgi:hypothetical protein
MFMVLYVNPPHTHTHTHTHTHIYIRIGHRFFLVPKRKKYFPCESSIIIGKNNNSIINFSLKLVETFFNIIRILERKQHFFVVSLRSSVLHFFGHGFFFRSNSSTNYHQWHVDISLQVILINSFTI